MVAFASTAPCPIFAMSSRPRLFASARAALLTSRRLHRRRSLLQHRLRTRPLRPRLRRRTPTRARRGGFGTRRRRCFLRRPLLLRWLLLLSASASPGDAPAAAASHLRAGFREQCGLLSHGLARRRACPIAGRCARPIVLLGGRLPGWRQARGRAAAGSACAGAGGAGPPLRLGRRRGARAWAVLRIGDRAELGDECGRVVPLGAAFAARRPIKRAPLQNHAQRMTLCATAGI